MIWIPRLVILFFLGSIIVLTVWDLWEILMKDES